MKRLSTFRLIPLTGGQAICHALSGALDLSEEQKSKSVLTKTSEWEALSEKVQDPAIIEKWWLSQEDLEGMRGE